MKAEINNENKAKFFALYWSQEVAENPLGPLLVNGRCLDYVMTDSMECVLNLKPLSQISDEDAIEVGMMNGCKEENSREFTVSFGKATVNQWMHKFPLNSFTSDYLRSKGYALPWIGLSVEEMVQSGWIKLVEE